MVKRWLWLRSLLWTVLVPGTVAIYLPYRILSRSGGLESFEFGSVGFVGILLIGAGSAILLHCIRQFAVTGHGTLSPLDAPIRLVTQGLYRYSRNPMYVGVMLILTGETVLFRSLPLLAYAGVCFLFFNLGIACYEEPRLRRQFGREYEAYCQQVGRWLPKL